MAQNTKYGRVTTERGNIPPDEPVFILRAQDALAPLAVVAYLKLCEEEGTTENHLTEVGLAYATLAEWQSEHPDRVKTPDS